MPVTGNNLPLVSFDTAKTVLVPTELYEEGTEGEYLRFNGMALGADEIAVASEPQNGIIAIMGVPADVRQQYDRGGVGVTSPLLSIIGGRRSGRGREVNILLTTENTYIAVRDKGLKMAEALPDASLDSLLYYMQVIGRQFRLRKFDINVGGARAEEAADMLRRYFAHVRIADAAAASFL